VETQTYATRITSKAGGTVISDSTVYSADVSHDLDNAADANAILHEALDIDVSTLEAFWIYSDQTVIVTPMDGLSATVDGPFTVAAKKAFFWNTGRPEACPFTADFTSLKIDNSANDAVANVKAGFLVHSAS
jgi:hypothetical protein